MDIMHIYGASPLSQPSWNVFPSSSQDKTQHSRRQILTSSADPPCAFFTCTFPAQLPSRPRRLC
ncbi:unnamed protein product [Penicillium roqueforti FM164]|uniref:Uncharacterized protein n=1 Tax=Penicillium roqueforti (strain FM164) TaxID=1365484 RepID=W6QM05_PENRF|nr:unnamed protein product [Penicillium roqueforti FM164]